MPRIAVGDVWLNYAVAGEGPAIVLTHGLGGSLDAWESLAARLSDRYRVVTWDVRGFGRSDKPEGPVTPSTWARDLRDLLATIEIDSAVISGISMGGVIAQRFALDFPETTRGLILISTSSEVGPSARDAWDARADLVEREGMAAGLTPGPALSYSSAYREAHAEAIEAAIRATVASNDPRCYAAACRAVSAYHYTAELQTISCPTLILQGLSDELTPPGGSVIMSRAIPEARIEFIADCGHAIPTEQPEMTFQQLDAFMRALPA